MGRLVLSWVIIDTPLSLDGSIGFRLGLFIGGWEVINESKMAELPMLLKFGPTGTREAVHVYQFSLKFHKVEYTRQCG